MFRYQYNYQAMNAIMEDGPNTLYLGDCTAAFDRPLLDSKNVKTVLTVAQGLMVNYPDGGIVHKVYNILDMESANIARLFNDTNNQIVEGLKRGSVLVHCAAGISRSASCVIAYLMKHHGMTFNDGLSLCKRKRSVVFPNYGFQRQLKQYERDLKVKETPNTVQQQPPQLVTKIVDFAAKLNQPTTEFATPSKKLNQLKDTRLATQFNANTNAKTGTQQQRKFNTTFNNRSNSTQPKFLLTSQQFNTNYGGPQIVTHQKNKMFESAKKGTNMPGITQKQNQYQIYPVYKKF